MSMKWKPYVIGGGALLFLGVFGWLVTHRGPLAPINVEVASAQSGDLSASVSGTGTVEARLSYAIGPVQAGRLLNVLVDQGDRVKAGQVLAEIDPVDLEQRINAAESAAQRTRQAVNVATAQEREAQSRFKLAQTNAERYRELVTKNFVSKEMADSRQNEANIAESALDAARSAVKVAQRDAERTVAERTGLAQQRANLKLISVANGIVVSRDAEPGATVVAGQAVVHVVDPDSLWVKARVDQGQAQGILPGQPAKIVLRSNQNETIAGKVARVDIQSDSVTEERVVNVNFSQPPARIYLGELAEITVEKSRIQDALFIPSAAVKRVMNQTGVWVIAQGKAKWTGVGTGIQTLDGKTQVRSGLRQGEQVIVYSDAQLQEGKSVRVVQK